MKQKHHRAYKYLSVFTVLYVAFQLIADVSAGKLIAIGAFTVSVTVLYFPFTYIIADVLTEVYGYAQARRVVWYVFGASVLAGLIYGVVSLIPAAPGFVQHDAYRQVFAQVPRTLLGGWVAVWVGGIANDYVLAKLKVWTKGKYLWLRTISSTVIGEGLNTALFYTIALYGILPNNVLGVAIIGGWLLKVGIEVVCTPLTYVVIHAVKRKERVDHYDRKTNFNPFVLR